MKSFQFFRSAFLVSVIFAAAVFMACGGSGGGSSSGGAAPASGSVAVMLTDGPLEDLATLIITITKISLLPGGNGNAVVIYDNPAGHPVDILQFRNQDFFFTLKKEVPAGRYEKIRLEVSDVDATAKFNTPGTCADLTIKLPSGKIDLNPQGGFEVLAGQTLSIRLDVDARKSIQLHQAGNSGKCIFRPVIFVDVLPVYAVERCPAVFKGQVLEYLYDENKFRNGFVLDLPGKRGSVNVIVDKQTVIFDKDAEIGNINDVQIGDMVYVRGPLTAAGSLTASLVVVGDVLKLEGTVASAVTGPTTKQFELNLDEGQAFTDPSIDVSLKAQTLIIIGCDSAVDESYIQVGSQATVIGRYSIAENALHAMVVIIKSREIKGKLVSITSGANQSYSLVVETVLGTTKTVILPQGEDVFLEGDGMVELTRLADLVGCGKNPTVRVMLDPSTATPLTAEKVYVIPEETSGIVDSVYPSTSRLRLDSGAIIEVETGAFILKKSKPVPFSEIAEKDEVTVFGLSACDTNPIDFFGYVVVVE
jgi:Domain of unknown function (DUF4382)